MPVQHVPDPSVRRNAPRDSVIQINSDIRIPGVPEQPVARREGGSSLQGTPAKLPEHVRSAHKHPTRRPQGGAEFSAVRTWIRQIVRPIVAQRGQRSARGHDQIAIAVVELCSVEEQPELTLQGDLSAFPFFLKQWRY